MTLHCNATFVSSQSKMLHPLFYNRQSSVTFRSVIVLTSMGVGGR